MTKKVPTLSVITVTKNRAPLLTKALASLVGQCKKGDEIIIVDASTDDTPTVVASFKKRLPLRYIRYLTPGYPAFYNKAAQVARGDILVFFDDDCVASRTFLARIRRAHQKNPNCVIQGMTYSIPKGNLYVDIMGDHYRNWLAMMTVSGNRMKSFDSKNASLPRKLFWQHNGLSSEMYRGSEDIELGIRLRRQGIPILFDRTIVASHHERTTLASFIAQHKRFAESEGYLDKVVPRRDRLGVIPTKKLILHLRSFVKRERALIVGGRWRQALFLPCLYGMLAIIRMWGYATNR
jgi:glycosyltransferase involved in cell wall biosynthesis